MGSASYRARWIRREDGVDPFIYWPEWDLLEVEDTLELWPEDSEALEAEEIRGSIVDGLRAFGDSMERVLAAFEPMLRDDAPTADALLQAMKLPERRPWEIAVTDENAAIAVRERCIFQSMLYHAFPERFVRPTATLLVAHLAPGAVTVPLSKEERRLPSMAARLIAESAERSELARYFGKTINERQIPEARELLISVTTEKTEADEKSGVKGSDSHALLTIMVPTYLVDGIEAQEDFFDSWAFLD